MSDHIRAMPFLWLAIEDEPGPESLRGYVERNAIGLLSNWDREDAVDGPSSDWLGNWAQREAIRESGLWNVNHVNEEYERQFLEEMEQLVGGAAPAR